MSTSNSSGTVSVIDTGTNTVVGTPITVGANPVGVGIVPPPQGVPFLAFSAKLKIGFGGEPNQDSFDLISSFTLSSLASRDRSRHRAGHAPDRHLHHHHPARLLQEAQGSFTLAGAMGGVSGQARITPTGTLRYEFNAAATGASLTGTTNPVPVMLTIGDDSGAASVRADIDH